MADKITDRINLEALNKAYDAWLTTASYAKLKENKQKDIPPGKLTKENIWSSFQQWTLTPEATKEKGNALADELVKNDPKDRRASRLLAARLEKTAGELNALPARKDPAQPAFTTSPPAPNPLQTAEALIQRSIDAATSENAKKGWESIKILFKDAYSPYR